MSKYKCSLCDYETNYKTHINNHVNRKIKCNEGIPSILEKTVDFICDYCNKTLTSKSNLLRHTQTCKIKKENIEKELEIKNEENRILKEKLAVAEALNKKPSTVNNTQINNNNNINVTLTPWNDPKLPANINDYYEAALKKLFLAVPTLIKNIHFNEAHPENHNICIRNGRSKQAKVFNGKEWVTMDEDTVIQTLISDYEHTLESYAEDYDPEYIEKMREIKDRDTDEKVDEDLQIQVKRVVYDRNYMVKIKN